MKSIVAFFLLILTPPVVNAIETTSPATLEGRWDGAIIVRPAIVEVGLTANIQRGSNGSWKGTLLSPTHERRDLRIEDLYLEGKAVSFIAIEGSNATQFRGNLSEDGNTIEGEVIEGDRRAPFWLQRGVGLEKTLGGRIRISKLDGNIEELRSAFNDDQESVRLLMILSPGCSDCRMKAFLVRQYILKEIRDPRLKVYTVWEKVGQGDSYALAQDVTWFPPDPRLRFFWSEGQLAGKIFNEAVALPGKPAWDVFLIFPAGLRWLEASASPHPSSFMHNLPELPKEKIFDIHLLANQLKTLLVSSDARSGSGKN